MVNNKGIKMKEIHLVMLRYTMDNSPLDDGGEYAEQVRFAFADLGNAELVADQMESDNSEDCTLYFVRSHPIMPFVRSHPIMPVVSKQQS